MISPFNELEQVAKNPNALFSLPDFNNVSDVLGRVANIVIGIGFAFGFVGLTVSLIKLVTSRGDSKAVDSARNGIVWSVMAIVVTIFALAIKYIFVDLVDVQDQNFKNDLPTI